ncbi:MAG: ribosome biogenesis GTPase YlqF [Pseudomonadota bacterium]
MSGRFAVKIQWFPGHMHKARKELAKRLHAIDLVIEVLDARIPYSSSNPMLDEIAGDKPRLRVLNKQDLADPDSTQTWCAAIEKDWAHRALPLDAVSATTPDPLIAVCEKLVPDKSHTLRGIQTLVVGIPNVGKSTLINLLVQRTVAKTGNEPAITRQQQRIDLGNGIVLFDSPGVLWPNIENAASGFRLGATGAVKDTALEYEEVALFLCEFLARRYPKRLTDRYREAALNGDEVETLESIGVARGCLGKGGALDWQRAAKVLVHDFRAGHLGAITLELPDDMRAEKASVERERELLAEKKKNKKA